MSTHEQTLSLGTATPPVPVRAFHLLLGLVGLSLVLNWVSREVIMSRGLQEVLLGGSLDAEGLERQWRLYQRMDLWSYLIAPVALVAQLAVTALLLQLGLALMGLEARFRTVFAVAVFAHVALMAQLTWITVYQAGLDPATLTAEQFYHSPLTLAGLRPGALGLHGAVLRAVSLFEVVWLGLLYAGLRGIRGVGGGRALALVAGFFVALNTLQVGLTLYLDRLGL